MFPDTSRFAIPISAQDLLASVFVYLDRVYSNDQNGQASIK